MLNLIISTGFGLNNIQIGYDNLRKVQFVVEKNLI